MFSVHTMPEEFKNATITGQFGWFTATSLHGHLTILWNEVTNRWNKVTWNEVTGYYLKENSVREIMITVATSFSKSSDFKSEKPAFSNSPALKSIFEKLHFGDRLVAW